MQSLSTLNCNITNNVYHVKFMYNAKVNYTIMGKIMISKYTILRCLVSTRKAGHVLQVC